MARPLLLLLALVAVLLVPGCASFVGNVEPDRPIVLALQPSTNPDMLTHASALEALLETGLRARGVERDLQVIVPATYAESIQGLSSGRVDAALMSAWPALQARDLAGANVVLAENREVTIDDARQVGSYYYSYYIVRADSPYRTMEDTRGATVAFPSKSSTSGYVFPVARLVDSGLVPQAVGREANPEHHFGNVLYSGSYRKAYEDLMNGTASVAVTAGDIDAELFGTILGSTRVLDKMGPIPSHGVVFRTGFERSGAGDALKASLLELTHENTPMMRKVVSGIFVQYVPTTTDEHMVHLAGAVVASGAKFQG